MRIVTYFGFKNYFYNVNFSHQITIEISAAFKMEDFYFICMSFNTSFVIEDIDIDMLKEKYKYHKYECMKINSDF